MPDQSSIQQKYKNCKYKVQVIVACLAGMQSSMSTNDASQVNKSAIYIGTCRIANNCRLHMPKDRVVTPYHLPFTKGNNSDGFHWVNLVPYI